MKRQHSKRQYKTKTYYGQNRFKNKFILCDDLYELRGLLKITLNKIDTILEINEFENKEIYKSNFNLK